MLSLNYRKYKLMEKAYELTPENGKTVFVGVPDKISIYSLPLAFNKSLEVSHGRYKTRL